MMIDVIPEETIPSRIIVKDNQSSTLAQMAQAAMLVALAIMGNDEWRELLGGSVSFPVSTFFLKSTIINSIGVGLNL
jgi:hypothetical protein